MIGDYLLQSDWMAQKKTSSRLAAVAHCWTYCVPFAVMLYFQGKSLNLNTIGVICGIYSTHYFIDRFRLARYVCWLKNFLAPRWIEQYWVGLYMSRNYPWKYCRATGYHSGRAAWLSVWLMIIADNTLHVISNGLFLYMLR